MGGQRNAQLVAGRGLVCTAVLGTGMLKRTPSLCGMNEEVQSTEARGEESGFVPALPHFFLQVSTWD